VSGADVCRLFGIHLDELWRAINWHGLLFCLNINCIRGVYMRKDIHTIRTDVINLPPSENVNHVPHAALKSAAVTLWIWVCVNRYFNHIHRGNTWGATDDLPADVHVWLACQETECSVGTGNDEELALATTQTWED